MSFLSAPNHDPMQAYWEHYHQRGTRDTQLFMDHPYPMLPYTRVSAMYYRPQPASDPQRTYDPTEDGERQPALSMPDFRPVPLSQSRVLFGDPKPAWKRAVYDQVRGMIVEPTVPENSVGSGHPSFRAKPLFQRAGRLDFA